MSTKFSDMMKGIVSAVVLLVAVAAASAEVTSSDITVYDYHRRFGIPEAARIKRVEQEALSSGAERIVGGSITDISVVPYQVGLLINLFILQSVCGASLISTTRAITAAHCNNDGVLFPVSFTVVLGSNTLFAGGTRVDTSDIVVHSGWNPSNAANDIAVLRFSAIEYSTTIQAIALPTQDDADIEAGVIALASGYGLTSDSGSIGILQRVSSVELPIITNEECASVYGSNWVHSSNVCTSGAGGRGTCQGDSGGPLVINKDGTPILFGATSYGAAAGCAAGFPAAYARITSFLPFIVSV